MGRSAATFVGAHDGACGFSQYTSHASQKHKVVPFQVFSSPPIIVCDGGRANVGITRDVCTVGAACFTHFLTVYAGIRLPMSQPINIFQFQVNRASEAHFMRQNVSPNLLKTRTLGICRRMLDLTAGAAFWSISGWF